MADVSRSSGPRARLTAGMGTHMGTHMKTTIDIADSLLLEGKAVAAREGLTLRALVEEGLRVVLRERAQRAAFTLRDGAVGGHGLQPGQVWDLPRDLAYDEEGAGR